MAAKRGKLYLQSMSYRTVVSFSTNVLIPLPNHPGYHSKRASLYFIRHCHAKSRVAIHPETPQLAPRYARKSIINGSTATLPYRTWLIK
jgi:capsular polysaccharide biosynthesis protein